MPVLVDRLHQEWCNFWDSMGKLHPIRGNGEMQFAELVGLYSGEGRYYHTLTHIDHCLREFSELRSRFQNPH
ncbi:MAG TPA: hypothetical protein VN495_01880, partial [Candidatus Paceibacterota bacterium]|nr:hypothetical protein [Candidatus Paceibacterota bacterium]